MQNLFCCARHLQTPEDPKCEQLLGCETYETSSPMAPLRAFLSQSRETHGTNPPDRSDDARSSSVELTLGYAGRSELRDSEPEALARYFKIPTVMHRHTYMHTIICCKVSRRRF